MGIVDGSEPYPSQLLTDEMGKTTSIISPDYLLWQKKDQYLLGWFTITLSKIVLSSIHGHCTPLDKCGHLWLLDLLHNLVLVWLI